MKSYIGQWLKDCLSYMLIENCFGISRRTVFIFFTIINCITNFYKIIKIIFPEYPSKLYGPFMKIGKKNEILVAILFGYF